jgi:hypothetical protein
MSRWTVLKDAIVNKKRSVNNDASIHRFPGHSSFQKQRHFWQGYKFRVPWEELSERNRFTDICANYIRRVDTSEIFVIITDSPSSEQISELLEKCRKNTEDLKFELLSSTDEPTIRVTDPHYLPQTTNFKYWSYSLSPFYSPVSVVTREPSEERKITVNDLLSDRLFGVDNTGNVCVWPSEPLLLYVILENKWIQDIIRGKSLLEIGGGVTG